MIVRGASKCPKTQGCSGSARRLAEPPLRVAPPGSRREGPQLARGHQPRVRRANASSERISQSTIPRLGLVESSLVGIRRAVAHA